jgi:hypothetical protein
MAVSLPHLFYIQELVEQIPCLTATASKANRWYKPVKGRTEKRKLMSLFPQRKKGRITGCQAQNQEAYRE